MTDEELRTLTASLRDAPPAGLAQVASDGLRRIWAQPGPVPDFGPGLTGSVDAALGLLSRTLPGWSVSLKGTAGHEDGHWSCKLRKSGLRDDEEVIGIGHAPTPSLAVVVALLRVLIIKATGYN